MKNWKGEMKETIRQVALRGLEALEESLPAILVQPDSAPKAYALKLTEAAIAEIRKARARVEKLKAEDPYYFDDTGMERRVRLVLSTFEHGQGKIYGRWLDARASVVLKAVRTFARSVAAREGRVWLHDESGPLEEVFE